MHRVFCHYLLPGAQNRWPHIPRSLLATSLRHRRTWLPGRSAHRRQRKMLTKLMKIAQGGRLPTTSTIMTAHYHDDSVFSTRTADYRRPRLPQQLTTTMTALLCSRRPLTDDLDYQKSPPSDTQIARDSPKIPPHMPTFGWVGVGIGSC